MSELDHAFFWWLFISAAYALAEVVIASAHARLKYTISSALYLLLSIGPWLPMSVPVVALRGLMIMAESGGKTDRA